MADIWDKLAQRADEMSDTMFVALEKGEKIAGVFIGEPHPKEVMWTGERYVELGSPEGKELIRHGKKPTFRAAINFFIPAEDSVKIFEMSAPTFRTLFKMRRKYGLEGYAFEIEKQSKSKYSILPDAPLSERERAKIKTLELHDLAQILADSDESQFDSYDPKTATAARAVANNPRPIDPNAFEELAARLKKLPRKNLDQFLKKIGVQRVREVPASKRAEAFNVLEALARTNIDPLS